MIRFQPMTEESFKRFFEEYVISYADELLVSKLFDDFPSAEAYSRKELSDYLPKGRLSKGQLLFDIMNDQNIPVGVIWVTEKVENTVMAWLFRISIYDPFRRKGYASAAIKKAEEIVQNRGMKQMGLNVFSYNAGAKKLYESLGYRVYKTFYTKKDNSVSRYEMVKMLSNR